MLGVVYCMPGARLAGVSHVGLHVSVRVTDVYISTDNTVKPSQVWFVYPPFVVVTSSKYKHLSQCSL